MLVVSAFPKLSETFIVSKFLGLLDRGWDVYIACQRFNKVDWDNFPELASRPHLRRRVQVSRPHQSRLQTAWRFPLVLLNSYRRNPMATSRYVRSGRRQIDRSAWKRLYLDERLLAARPALIHFEFGSLAASRMVMRSLLECPITVSFRGYDLNYVGLEEPDYYEAVWRHADAIHLLGKDLWRRAVRRGCPRDKPHALIPPAVDTDRFRPDPDRGNGIDDAGRPVRLISVGRLEWKKGYEYALQAVRLLLDRGVACSYHIVGDGDYREALTFARYQLDLEEHVHFHGAVPSAEIPQKLAWADIFLHAAVSEGFGNAVLEAQAMELPVVCSDADGLAENVADGETGYVVSRRDPAAMADCLAYLAGSASQRQRLGRAGRERVLACFNLPDQIAAFDRFYRQVLQAHAR